MSLTHDQYKKIDKLNKRLEQWDKKGTKSFAVTQTRDMLEEFYLKHNINTQKMKSLKFRKRTANMSQAEIDEMMTIADYFESAVGSKVSTYNITSNKSYETAKRLYPMQVKDFKSWVNWVDKMRNQDSALKEYYDSDEIAKIYDYGISKKLNEKEIEEIMKKQTMILTTARKKRYTETKNAIDDYFNNKKKSTKTAKKKNPRVVNQLNKNKRKR